MLTKCEKGVEAMIAVGFLRAGAARTAVGSIQSLVRRTFAGPVSIQAANNSGSIAYSTAALAVAAATSPIASGTIWPR